MTASKPLMPKATAVWLVENTSLTFDQIAEFCELHMLEVKGIADGDVAQGIRGKDPITGGELTREEIKAGEADPSYRLKLRTSKVKLPEIKTKKAPRYTPVSRRQDRPNAILWLVKNHPEMKDSQIIKLVGTTKPTIQQIRDRTHWNSASLQPQDPVALGLCTQIDLDAEVQKAAQRVEKERREMGDAFTPAGATLAATAETTNYVPPGLGEQPSIVEPPAETNETEDARMLEQLNRMSSGEAEEPEEPPASLDDVFAKIDASPADDGEATDQPDSTEPEDQPDNVSP
ncbi:MAG: cell cycle transcriptional regulator TrcR [Pseudomonadota bacterium]